VQVEGPGGGRKIPMQEFHRTPGDAPERDTVLEPGELIVAIEVPASVAAARSRYLKIRDRASFEFALVAVAAAGLEVGDETVRDVRLAAGGVGTGRGA
jgi:xanthine dehydrogenase YagS FAD-binding subunit